MLPVASTSGSFLDARRVLPDVSTSDILPDSTTAHAALALAIVTPSITHNAYALAVAARALPLAAPAHATVTTTFPYATTTSFCPA
jgi:hypothetical protein